MISTTELADPTHIEGTCVVIGASRGFGRALTIELQRQGVPTVSASRSPVSALCTHTADARNLKDMQRIRDCVPSGPRHVFYCASTATGVGPALSPDEDEVRAAMEVNYFAMINVVSAFGRSIRAFSGSSFTLIGSSAAGHPPDLLSGYGASKAAAESYVRGLAGELAGSGARANVLRIAAETGLVIEHRRLKAVLRGSIREHDALPQPRDNVSAALFLASTAAHFINNQTLSAHWKAGQ